MRQFRLALLLPLRSSTGYRTAADQSPQSASNLASSEGGNHYRFFNDGEQLTNKRVRFTAQAQRFWDLQK